MQFFFNILAGILIFTGCGQNNLLGFENVDSITPPVSNRTKILFVGNSYTFVNEVYAVVKGLAKEIGIEVDVHTAMNGGFRLSQNWSTPSQTGAPNASNQIVNGKFDYVVLQEISRAPWTPLERTDFLDIWAPRYSQFVRRHGAIPVFYMTWSRKNMMETPGDTNQALVSSMYIQAARSGQARCAPAGNAFKKYLDTYGTRDSLHNTSPKDLSHPTELGTYIAGCALFSTLFRTSPVGNPYRTVQNIWFPNTTNTWWVPIEPTVASNVQQVVWDVYNENLADYRGP